MTDNEIIKALEMCIADEGCEGCVEHTNPYCMNNVMEHALGLIKKQQERMDRIVGQLEEAKNHCDVGCYEDYDPYEDGRFETYEEVITLLKGVQNE